MTSIIDANKISTEVGSKITELLQNPFANAVQTNHPRLPKYYTIAGPFTIAFEVLDEEVELKHVCNSTDFNRALTKPMGI